MSCYWDSIFRDLHWQKRTHLPSGKLSWLVTVISLLWNFNKVQQWAVCLLWTKSTAALLSIRSSGSHSSLALLPIPKVRDVKPLLLSQDSLLPLSGSVCSVHSTEVAELINDSIELSARTKAVLSIILMRESTSCSAEPSDGEGKIKLNVLKSWNPAFRVSHATLLIGTNNNGSLGIPCLVHHSPTFWPPRFLRSQSS